MPFNRRINSDRLLEINAKYQVGDYIRLPHTQVLGTILRVGKPYWSSLHNCAKAGTLVVQPTTPTPYTEKKPHIYCISTLESTRTRDKYADNFIRSCNQ